jgi:hypothetical protein
MKIIETYQCDFCKMPHKTKTECRGCEERHAGLDTLTMIEANHGRNEKRYFPQGIIIKSSRTNTAVGIYEYSHTMEVDDTYWEMRPSKA